MFKENTCGVCIHGLWISYHTKTEKGLIKTFACSRDRKGKYLGEAAKTRKPNGLKVAPHATKCPYFQRQPRAAEIISRAICFTRKGSIANG